ncbi:MAG TPA: HAD family hydrolase [Candidatus Woesearchaeota archaeon]|nr:HAD family hydrolase [Candidatus Woesearchaeota archaeon]
MIKLLILDLDNTLFDTYGQLAVKVFDDMLLRMRKAGLTKKQEEVLRREYPLTGFRILAKQLRLSDEIKRIGMSTYKNMDLSKIKPFPDVKLLKNFKQRKILVTSGTKEVQLRKVDILGIKDLFDEIIVDESSNPQGKQKIFSKILSKYNVKPNEVMVIGDNAKSEINAGNNLGMITIQILRRQLLRGKADYHVKNLYGVKKILEKTK